MPRCDECLSAEIHDAPGIGFDLALSYGTAAVHHHGGLIQTIAKIPANPEYEDLLRQLTSAPKPPPPSSLQKLRRRLNKALGYPSTPLVGTLSNLILSLKSATSTKLSQPLTQHHIAVTTPSFPALTQEDINDALEFAGLQTWLPHDFAYPNRISEANAAFAANGNGLCTNYRDFYTCEDEGEEMPQHQVLSITFTTKVLYVTLENMFKVFKENPAQNLVDFDAGLGAREGYESSEAFWKHVYTQIVALPNLAMSQKRGSVTKVILLGDCVGDPEFKEMLKDALGEIRKVGIEANATGGAGPSVEVETMADPLYAAAQGVATYARRRQEVPRACKEAKDCEKKRRESSKGRVVDDLRR